MKDTIFYGVQALAEPKFSTGTWTLTDTSDLMSWKKTAGDETPVCTFRVPKYNQGAGWGGRVKSVGVIYSVATAALEAAPSVTLHKITLDQTTKIATDAAVTHTDSVAGSDTTGTAAGNYSVIATVADADLVSDDENTELNIKATFNAAATTVLEIYGLEVQYA